MVQSWLDNAGLYQKYGVDQTTPNKGGEYSTLGELRDIEFSIDLTKLTQTETPLSDTVFFPIGMKIEQLEIFCDEAAATGTAIDLGFIQTDRSTEIDFNGLLDAYPTASMTLGSKVTLVSGGTNAGVLVGGTTSVPGYVSCSNTTATAFTAGKIRVRIKYSKP